jgi:hypothetical protein
MLRGSCFFSNLLGLIFGAGTNEETDLELPIVYLNYRLHLENVSNKAVYCKVNVPCHANLVVYNNPKKGCYIATESDFVLNNQHDSDWQDYLKRLGYIQVDNIEGAVLILDHPFRFIRNKKKYTNDNKEPKKFTSAPIEIRYLPNDLSLPLVLIDGYCYFDDGKELRKNHQSSLCRLDDWLEMRNMLQPIQYETSVVKT